MRTVYYAHPMSLYGTPQQQRDIETLKRLGFGVFNPDQPSVQKRVDDAKGDRSKVWDVMAFVFKPLVTKCDALAFRAFPDGRIPAGVMKEIEYAREKQLPVFELPHSLTRRALTVEETRETLAELGQR